MIAHLHGVMAVKTVEQVVVEQIAAVVDLHSSAFLRLRWGINRFSVGFLDLLRRCVPITGFLGLLPVELP